MVTAYKEKIVQHWKTNILGCPICKDSIIESDQGYVCTGCASGYPEDNEIPSLIADGTRIPLEAEQLPVKSFYLKERYDWTRDPRGLEYLYHHFRKWETWNAIKQHIRPESLVLDIGCGTGLITSILSRHRYRTVALDLNRWSLVQMNGKPYVVKAQADAESLPIQDSSVDIVIATEVLEHLEDPVKTAQEMLRVCKPGGHIIGSVPSTHRIWKMRRKLSMSCPGNEPFHHNYSRKEIAALWQQAGYKAQIRSMCLGLNWLLEIEKRR